MKTKAKSGKFAPTGMEHADFAIGCEFLTAVGRWRCTDVGTRTIAAIRLDLDHDPTWYDGPPYAVVEHTFDEDGIAGCSPAPKRRRYDDSGRSRITAVDFKARSRQTSLKKGA